MSPITQTRYFDNIIKEIGFDPNYDFGLFDPLPDEHGNKYPKPLLETNEHGDVIYNVMDINGNIIADDVADAKSKQKYKPFQIVRKADPGEGAKYMPIRQGQGVWPWISKEIVELYKAKKKVKRLILTEGYKKAFVACKKGIVCIGLPGITVWKAKESKEIFKDIKLFAEQCHIEDILWLTDADTLHIHYEQGKDLYKRANSFYTSVNLFKSLCRDWNVNLYYAHIHEDSQHKGIDDLLLENETKVKQITKELNSDSGQSFFFSKYNISTMSYNKIQEIFGIHHNALTFYEKYQKFIGLEQFVYRNGVYYYDTEKMDLVYLKAGESAQYIRVNDKIFMKASMPTTTTGVHKNSLIETTTTALKAKFKEKSNKEADRLIYDIDYFDGFFNEPSHTNYNPSIEVVSEDGFITKWYNRYYKLTHKLLDKKIEEGDIPLSIKFMKHIWGSKELTYKDKVINQYELGLDYMQLLLLNPKQFLPIVALVSEENQTGKTIYWRWCVAIFQQNAKIIPPEMLTGNFTSYFIHSLLVVIDEALFNKRETMERVKTLTTNSETMVNGKFAQEIETQTYLKMGLSSNNVNDFAILSKNDQRFWILDVPVINDEDYVPDFFDKLKLEIPMFLTFLSQRTMATDKDDDRMYFSMEVRRTEGLLRVIDKSRTSDEVLIENAVKDYLVNSRQLIVHLGISDIRDLTDERTLQINKIRWVLENKMNKKSIGYTRHYNFYKITISDNEDSEDSVSVCRRKTNYYIFSALDYFTIEEIFAIYSMEAIIEAEEQRVFIKDKISAKDYFELKYMDKEPPLKLDEFIVVYKNSDTFKELEKNIHKSVIGNEMPF